MAEKSLLVYSGINNISIFYNLDVNISYGFTLGFFRNVSVLRHAPLTILVYNYFSFTSRYCKIQNPYHQEKIYKNSLTFGNK